MGNEQQPETPVLGFVGIAPVQETLIGMVCDFKADDADRDSHARPYLAIDPFS